MVIRPVVKVGPVYVRLLCCVSGSCVLFLTHDMLMSIAASLVQSFTSLMMVVSLV